MAPALEFGNTINLGTWFKKPEYSDLTIKPSNGQEIHVHKIIVCARNDYFSKLCGPQSKFAVSVTRYELGNAGTDLHG